MMLEGQDAHYLLSTLASVSKPLLDGSCFRSLIALRFQIKALRRREGT